MLLWLLCTSHVVRSRVALPQQRHALSRAYMMVARDAETYSVTLEKPLGLVLDEVTPGGSDGVEVGATREGSAAEACGLVQPGDRLLSVGEDDLTRCAFDDVMERLVAAPSPVALRLSRATYEGDEAPLDITPNLLKTLSSEDAVLVDRTVRAARSAVRASPTAARELGRLVRIEIVAGAGVQKDGSVKVRFFAIFTTGSTSAGSYSCNVSATGVPEEGAADGTVEITKLSCAKDVRRAWPHTGRGRDARHKRVSCTRVSSSDPPRAQWSRLCVSRRGARHRRVGDGP